MAAEGKQNKQIAAVLNCWPKKVGEWRRRFLKGGIPAIEKDAPRSGRPPVITSQKVQQVLELTTTTTPANATHWSTRSMAEVAGISDSSVQRIRRDHGLKPHRVLTRALRWVELSTTCGSNVNGQIAWFSPIWITAKER